jgi:hypothetical protein
MLTPVTANLSREMDTELQTWLNELDDSVDPSPWKVDVSYDRFKSLIYVTVTAPDDVSKKEVFEHRIETLREVRDLVEREQESWQHRAAFKHQS